MKLTFLGTGAADWKPENRVMQGFRRNAALLVDDCLLIDPGPQVPEALQSFSKDAAQIRYILNTHRHSDHYSECTLAHLPQATLTPMQAGDVCTLGRYTVTALKANHSTCKEAVHFLLDDGEKTLFYGLDGAWLLYDEVSAIKKQGVDLAVLDATVGDLDGDYRIFEHNNLSMVMQLKAALQDHVKRFIISHMARKLHDAHEVLARRMQEHHIEVAFDGLEIEL